MKKRINAFVHVGGREGCWKLFSKFLEKQNHSHDDIKLIVVNTTPEHKFYKEWLDKCDYEYVYCETPIISKGPGARLMEMMRQEPPILEKYVYGEYFWRLDDDVIPPTDVLSNLLPHFTGNVMAVSACYRLAPRIGMSDFYCCWPINHNPLYYTKSEGLQSVGGVGGGCCLFKLKDGKFMWDIRPKISNQHPQLQGDVIVCRKIHDLGGTVVVNWDVECDHLADDGSNPFPLAVKYLEGEK